MILLASLARLQISGIVFKHYVAQLLALNVAIVLELKYGIPFKAPAVSQMIPTARHVIKPVHGTSYKRYAA